MSLGTCRRCRSILLVLGLAVKCCIGLATYTLSQRTYYNIIITTELHMLQFKASYDVNARFMSKCEGGVNNMIKTEHSFSLRIIGNSLALLWIIDASFNNNS